MPQVGEVELVCFESMSEPPDYDGMLHRAKKLKKGFSPHGPFESLLFYFSADVALSSLEDVLGRLIHRTLHLLERP